MAPFLVHALIGDQYPREEVDELCIQLLGEATDLESLYRKIQLLTQRGRSGL